MTIIELTEQSSSPQLSSLTPIVEYGARSLIIVAIHGLYEDTLQTWTHAETRIVWLRDLFPHRKYKARILLYGYKAESLKSPGEGPADRILPHANSLVAELCADRQLSNALKRPIIFICHGFGGLLIKRALAFSHSRRAKAVEHLRSLYTSTYGVLFRGTPHNGVRSETLLLSQQDNGLGPSQCMISPLKGSEMLSEITDQFAPLMKQFLVYNFWEQIETHVGDIKAYMVDKDSAAPVWDNVERCGIIATHSGMTKFKSSADPGYRVILEVLIRYITHAPQLIKLRWENDLKSLVAERQREAEVLLKPNFQSLLSDDAIMADINKWFLVPRRSSNIFTRRQLHAKAVKEKFGRIQKQNARKKHKILVIYGLGGSGKTQFCLKYLEDMKSSYWGMFWIDASTKENAESSFASLGQQVGKGATFVAGIHWLSRCSKPWLLVIDNADDPDIDVSQYIPAGWNGHIIITTRNPGVMTHTTAGHIKFHGVDPEEAIDLLLRSAYPQDEQEYPNPQNRMLAQGIASELGFLALALVNAGTTIRCNVYTLERYLHYYLGHRREMMSYPRLKNADETNIITTWEIPFRRIIDRNASPEHRGAVQLRHVFAFMHFEFIPESVFLRSWNNVPRYEIPHANFPDIFQVESAWNEEAQARLRRAVRVLYNYSIVDHDPDKGVCSLHPVVQRWARDRLTESEQKKWLGCTTAVVAHCISPDLEASGQRYRRLLLPHIESCLRAMRSQHSSLPETAVQTTEMERFAWVYAENGLWKQARMLQRQVIDFRVRVLGRRHEDTIRAQCSLRSTYWNLFEIKSAVEVQLQVLQSRWWSRPSLAYWIAWPPWKPNHISYLLALNDLTHTLWLAGKRDLSKMAGERAVKGLMKHLGPEDPKTLTAMFNLARTYLHLGDQKTSHRLLLQVLVKRKHFFGLNHPDTLTTRNEVGMSLCAGRRHLAAAERLVTNVLKCRRKILGEEHAYTLWSVNDLSKVLCERGRLQNAVRILEETIPVAIRTLGEDHIGVSMTRSNLARAYSLSKRWTEAEENLRLLLNQIPSEHPDWFHAMSGYIHVQMKLGHVKDAENISIDIMDKVTRTKALTLDHPRTVIIAKQLSNIYRMQGRTDKIAASKKRIPAVMEHGELREHFNVLPVAGSI